MATKGKPTQAKSAREIQELFSRLANDAEAGRELDKRLQIPESSPWRRDRIEAVAHAKLGFPHDSQFTKSQVLQHLLVTEGLEQERTRKHPHTTPALTGESCAKHLTGFV
jgi:hypothetical protein